MLGEFGGDLIGKRKTTRSLAKLPTWSLMFSSTHSCSGLWNASFPSGMCSFSSSQPVLNSSYESVPLPSVSNDWLLVRITLTRKIRYNY